MKHVTNHPMNHISRINFEVRNTQESFAEIQVYDNPSLQLYINVEMQLESRTYTYEMNDHKNTILIITRELYKTPGFQKRIRIINVHRLISKTLIANTSIY